VRIVGDMPYNGARRSQPETVFSYYSEAYISPHFGTLPANWRTNGSHWRPSFCMH